MALSLPNLQSPDDLFDFFRRSSLLFDDGRRERKSIQRIERGVTELFRPGDMRQLGELAAGGPHTLHLIAQAAKVRSADPEDQLPQGGVLIANLLADETDASQIDMAWVEQAVALTIHASYLRQALRLMTTDATRAEGGMGRLDVPPYDQDITAVITRWGGVTTRPRSDLPSSP